MLSHLEEEGNPTGTLNGGNSLGKNAKCQNFTCYLLPDLVQ